MNKYLLLALTAALLGCGVETPDRSTGDGANGSADLGSHAPDWGAPANDAIGKRADGMIAAGDALIAADSFIGPDLPAGKCLKDAHCKGSTPLCQNGACVPCALVRRRRTRALTILCSAGRHCASTCSGRIRMI